MSTKRYTTPKHIFKVGVDLTNATYIFITYQQDGQIIVEKTIEDVTVVDSERISINLTQEETGRFKRTVGSVNQVYINIRVGFADGSRAASKMVRTSVSGVLKEGEF